MNNEQLNWIESTGGPFVLLPEEIVSSWSGVDGDDYDTACDNSDDEVNFYNYDGTKIVFLGDEPHNTTCAKTKYGACLFRWIYGRSKEGMRDRIDLYDYSTVVSVHSDTFCTLDSGMIAIFDSSMSPDDLAEECNNQLRIELEPNCKYGLSFEYVDLDEEHQVLVNKIFRIAD